MSLANRHSLSLSQCRTILRGKPLAGEKRYHFFILRHYDTGENQAYLLSVMLEERGYRVKMGPNQAHETDEVMKDQVRASECLLVLLTGGIISADGHFDTEYARHQNIAGEYQGIFTQRSCHEAISTGRTAGLRCCGVMETDRRHGCPDFKLERVRARTGGKDGGPIHE